MSKTKPRPARARARGPFLWLATAAGVAVAISACASLKQADRNEGALDGASSGDGSTASDGSPGSDASDAADQRPTDGGADAPVDALADGPRVGPTGLDPDLVLPNLASPSCSSPGNPSSCGGVRACRMATPDSGRCDDCNPAGLCGSLVTQPCANSLDCDINLQCFRGKCTLFCTLPLGPECGAANGCVDVGSVQRGLCDPAKL